MALSLLEAWATFPRNFITPLAEITPFIDSITDEAVLKNLNELRKKLARVVRIEEDPLNTQKINPFTQKRLDSIKTKINTEHPETPITFYSLAVASKIIIFFTLGEHENPSGGGGGPKGGISVSWKKAA